MKTNMISFKEKITLGFFAIIGLMVIVITSTMINYAHTEQDLQKIKNVFLPNALLSGQMARDVVQVQQFLNNVSATRNNAGYADAERSREDFKNGLEQYRQYVADDPDKTKAIATLEMGFNSFYADGKRMTEAYLNEGQEAGDRIMNDFDHAASKLSSQMIRLRNSESNGVKSSIQNIFDDTHQMRNTLWIMAFVIISMAIAIALLLSRHLGKQLGIDPIQAKGIAKEIADGHLSREITLRKGDKDSLLHSIKNMQQKLLIRRTEERHAAAEILRIKIGLDNASKGIMMADNNRNLVYLNNAAKKILKVYETEVEEQSLHFDVENLIGLNIDMFHKNSAHQIKLLDSLTESIFSYAKLGSRMMTVVASPIINEQGERLGTVAEWYDCTAEAVVEEEVAKIVKAASCGDFSQRFNLEDKEDFLLDLTQGLNQLLNTCETGLKDIAQVLAAISNGDLTKKITSDYEGTFGQLKHDTNTTVETLKIMIEQIRSATDSIYSGSKEIAAGNNDLSSRTEMQGTHLQETTMSMKQLTQSVQNNVNNAHQADCLVTNSVTIAMEGGKVVENVIAMMGNINESSRRIEDIIAVIDDIAFQTNILALNAAVEAARAGEQGKGFAVVATEVRNLAQRAAIAADEIKKLIADSVSKVNNGSQLVEQAGQTMDKIIVAIQGVTQIMSEISGASTEQNADIIRVNQAISQMDNATQQNAALVEQSAAAAESLEEQAQNLAVVIRNFKIEES
ncbi:MAG: methyl-accepting chemotaxis protein [Methylococcales bacterium]|nr:methyl-accepting chemotaxis protein [Methylococcales bacterium]MDD5754659.1 methyl-accepting chemotaxis protein [Methylococcales bacterium]